MRGPAKTGPLIFGSSPIGSQASINISTTYYLENEYNLVCNIGLTNKMATYMFVGKTWSPNPYAYWEEKEC